jgi:signal transduction histidine kinase
MPNTQSSDESKQPESYETLKERNRVLEEQLSAQEDMLSRTTNYLDELQEQLRQSNEKLEDYNQNLEEKVNARTRELEQKNTELEKENREKTAYQNRLEKANTELNNLMYRASHDLRAPLTNAMGLVELINQEIQDNQGTVEYLRTTLNDMLTIVDSLHHIIYYQNLNEAPAIIDCEESLKAAFKDAQKATRIDQGSLEIQVSHDKNLQVLPESFRVLFFQIFKNSLQFAQEGTSPPIGVHVLEHETYWYITVDDNSQGMNEKIANDIFDMFTKGSVDSGKGLGLFQAKTLAEKMGGTIALTRNTPSGTTFAISLPKSQA